MGYIYKITNNGNGKIYIGQTKQDIQSRFIDHKKCAEQFSLEKLGHRSHCPLRKRRTYSIIKYVLLCPVNNTLTLYEYEKEELPL